MSLINPSYFKGDIVIANLSQDSVQQAVQLAIDTYEPVYLQGVLGYDLYAQFAAGLQAVPIADQWLFLRDGVEYYKDDYSNRLNKWQGLASSAVFSPATQTASTIVYTTGKGGINPIAGQSQFSDQRLQNASYWIERKNSGTMELGVDYDMSNNNATFKLLRTGDAFSDGEQFVIHFTKAGTKGDILPQYNSPIAYFVYWNYMRQLATDTTGTGEVAPQNANSQLYGWSTKADSAWNKMYAINKALWQWMETRPDFYGTYWKQQREWQFSKTVNMFNI